jgi:hypothetical protein
MLKQIHIVSNIIPLSIEIQCFTFYHVFYLLIHQINVSIENMAKEPISRRKMNKLRFAYKILHELCEDMNRICMG